MRLLHLHTLARGLLKPGKVGRTPDALQLLIVAERWSDRSHAELQSVVRQIRRCTVTSVERNAMTVLSVVRGARWAARLRSAGSSSSSA